MLSVSTPQREICAQLHIGRGVLSRYKKLADEAKVAYSTVGRMSEEQIHNLLQSPPVSQPSDQKTELNELLPDYVEDLARHRHLTIQLYMRNTSRHIPTAMGIPNSRNTSVITNMRTTFLITIPIFQEEKCR